MTKVKKSTLSIERCSTVSTLQKILGGKWKIEILYYISFQDVHRFGELRRHIGNCGSLKAIVLSLVMTIRKSRPM